MLDFDIKHKLGWSYLNKLKLEGFGSGPFKRKELLRRKKSIDETITDLVEKEFQQLEYKQEMAERQKPGAGKRQNWRQRYADDKKFDANKFDPKTNLWKIGKFANLLDPKQVAKLDTDVRIISPSIQTQQEFQQLQNLMLLEQVESELRITKPEEASPDSSR